MRGAGYAVLKDPDKLTAGQSEAFSNRIKVTIRMAYGFHHANSLIALVMLRCAGNHGASDNRDTPLLTYRRSMVL